MFCVKNKITFSVLWCCSAIENKETFINIYVEKACSKNEV